jgi:hypothetical protein
MKFITGKENRRDKRKRRQKDLLQSLEGEGGGGNPPAIRGGRAVAVFYIA